MKKLLWIAAAFIAGVIVSHAPTAVKAAPLPYPGWILVGACYVGPQGSERIYEIAGSWVRTTNRGIDGPDDWRNLAVTPTLRRITEETCRQIK